MADQTAKNVFFLLFYIDYVIRPNISVRKTDLYQVLGKLITNIITKQLLFHIILVVPRSTFLYFNGIYFRPQRILHFNRNRQLHVINTVAS